MHSGRVFTDHRAEAVVAEHALLFDAGADVADVVGAH